MTKAKTISVTINLPEELLKQLQPELDKLNVDINSFLVIYLDRLIINRTQKKFQLKEKVTLKNVFEVMKRYEIGLNTAIEKNYDVIRLVDVLDVFNSIKKELKDDYR